MSAAERKAVKRLIRSFSCLLKDDGNQSWLMIGGGVPGGWGGGLLTLSERQAVAGLEAAAEQDEGLRGGRVGEVDHLQAALQRQLVAQVEQVLLLHGDARLSCHLLKEARHPGRMETRRRIRGTDHVRIHARLFFNETDLH